MGGISDPRGRLFYEIHRIVNYHKPYILLLENVKNILTIDGGNVGKTIESKLDELGYTLHKNILNASYFGIPQARERVYFVALRKDMKTSNKRALDYNPPKANRENIFLEDILETNVDADFFINRKDIRVLKKENEVENKLEPIRVGIVNKGAGKGKGFTAQKDTL